MTKTDFEFWNWGPARRVGSPSEARTISVIVIYLLFVICNLEFSSTSASPFRSNLPAASCLLPAAICPLTSTLSLFEPADQSTKWWFFVLTESLDWLYSNWRLVSFLNLNQTCFFSERNEPKNVPVWLLIERCLFCWEYKILAEILLGLVWTQAPSITECSNLTYLHVDSTFRGPFSPTADPPFAAFHRIVVEPSFSFYKVKIRGNSLVWRISVCSDLKFAFV